MHPAGVGGQGGGVVGGVVGRWGEVGGGGWGVGCGGGGGWGVGGGKVGGAIPCFGQKRDVDPGAKPIRVGPLRFCESPKCDFSQGSLVVNLLIRERLVASHCRGSAIVKLSGGQPANWNKRQVKTQPRYFPNSPGTLLETTPEILWAETRNLSAVGEKQVFPALRCQHLLIKVDCS